MRGGSTAQCFIHGKRRNMECLMDNGSGGLQCKPESLCQMSKADDGKERMRGMCSIHNKVRSCDCLVEDGSGGMQCKPDLQCKQTGDIPAWGRKRSENQQWGAWSPPVWMMAAAFGKGKGGWKIKGQGRGGGPNQKREVITSEPIRGTVSEWKGHFGWIELASEVEHPSAKKHGGKVYIHKQDVVSDDKQLTPGSAVSFILYADATGLGAQMCAPV
mmetsp:Transcript_81820/g.128864  ORF Transcript_81820/g.128864 Transcript_81820/m.128864 type:complete len:216 (+) Transcript_81820:69-716(+)